MGDTNPLLLLAVVLVAGTGAGLLARRCGLPSVTGQVLAGVLLGPGLGLFGPDGHHGMETVMEFALGLMAVAVGSHLHARRLRNARRRLALLVLFEATLTPLLVASAVALAPGGSAPLALLLGALAVSTAPATILALVKEARAKGVFVKTLVAGVALNNVAAIVLFELARAAVHASLDPTGRGAVLDLVLAPAGTVLGSVGLGGGVGVLLVVATRRVLRPDRLATLSMIAILLTVGLAAESRWLSTLLSCLSLGVVLANLTPEKEEIGHKVFEDFEGAIFAIFFTVAGAELDFAWLVPGGLLAIAVFAARALGKIAAAWLAMVLAGATTRLRRLLGLALLPQAGLAVGLMLLVVENPVFQPIASLFLAVVLTLVLLNELVGPVVARWALRHSGDWGRDRARLIDFLHEENITTDLGAETVEEAIERLVDVLVRTHGLEAERERLLASVLARERQESTLLGEGLAIPHGNLGAGDEILGAMGISRDGLPFDTPDGQPVHCMVLLATPPTERNRHLEVLAAFARAIGMDRTVRQQLYHARSAAHAYELLHAEEATEDFNTFLDQAEP